MLWSATCWGELLARLDLGDCLCRGAPGARGATRDPEPLVVGATGQDLLPMGSLCSRPWVSTPGL